MFAISMFVTVSSVPINHEYGNTNVTVSQGSGGET